MKILIQSLVSGMCALGALGAASEFDIATLKTFSVMGKEEEILEAGKEVELLRHDGKGCLTHRWFALRPCAPTTSLDNSMPGGLPSQ